jgi:uncharacterized protein YndB with AHSA1/START domain
MEKVVELERKMELPVEKVFALWLDPLRFPQWFLPDPHERLGRVQLDPKVGGHFLIEMILGPQTLPHTGTFRKIETNKAISFTWHSHMTGAQGSLVELEFESQGKQKSLLRLRHHDLDTIESREAHAKGWAQILGAIEVYLLAQGEA